MRIGSTQIREALRGRIFFEHSFSSRESTPAMQMGTAIHALITGKGEEVVVSPFENFKTKVARLWKNDQQQRGALVLTKKEHQEVLSAVDSSSLYMDGCSVILAEEELSGVRNDLEVAGRCDLLVKHAVLGLVLVDIKTSAEDFTSPKQLHYKIINNNIHVQIAHYADLLAPKFNIDRVAILYLCTKPPFSHRIILLDKDYLEIGLNLRDKGIENIKEYIQEQRDGIPIKQELIELEYSTFGGHV